MKLIEEEIDNSSNSFSSSDDILISHDHVKGQSVTPLDSLHGLHEPISGLGHSVLCKRVERKRSILKVNKYSMPNVDVNMVIEGSISRKRLAFDESVVVSWVKRTSCLLVMMV